MGTISTVFSFWMMQRMGRRAVLFIGVWGQLLACGLIGVLSLLPDQTPGVVW